jgi:hypothetical protein
MDLVHVDVASAELGADPAPLAVAHSQTGLVEPLREGQDLVITDRDGEFHAAVVLAVDETGGEPVYSLHVGARLPVDMAAQRLADVDLLPEHRGLHEIVDLLAELRDAERFRRPR